MIALVDSHSHVDVDAFDADRADVLRRARAAGVHAQIVPGIMADTWPALREVCSVEASLHAAYGLHPTFLDHHAPGHIDLLRDWIARESPCAVGECGLDRYIDDPRFELQQRYFLAQCEIAKEAGLPLIVHARRAFEDVILALRRIGGLRGVVHSFAGSMEQAEQLFGLGFCIGIGGPVTYERARRIRHVVRHMPLEFLLLETDSPDQPNATRRGQRNEPAHLTEVLDCIATLRGESREAIARVTTANAERLFGIRVSA
ncbi:TatD DNase family protein [Chiayiivirga flava]|uniref:TatD DNase family protein n=1 Tax=Chiayiivirga flava TaxID=659595 RepID=A0A7W8FYY7_9GAMM|nr:TatD family hydrolase [Chiayiivirga flava]MBB5206619.1 TatD DNase family protein [Chiayiivirga flava]